MKHYAFSSKKTASSFVCLADTAFFTHDLQHSQDTTSHSTKHRRPVSMSCRSARRIAGVVTERCSGRQPRSRGGSVDYRDPSGRDERDYYGVDRFWRPTGTERHAGDYNGLGGACWLHMFCQFLRIWEGN